MAARAVFKDVGLFHPQLQRKRQRRLDGRPRVSITPERGEKGLMYVPELVVYAHVLEERLCKDYHRRWYCGHGHFYAVMRDAEFESSKLRLFDVPSHLYRRTCSNAFDWLKHRLTNKSGLEFQQELEMQFFWGFFQNKPLIAARLLN